MGIIDAAKRLYRGEGKIMQDLPTKQITGITESINKGSALPHLKAVGMGAINPYFEWKERAENVYGKPFYGKPAA